MITVGLFDLFRSHQRVARVGGDDYLAVPLTPNEVALLVEVLNEDHRLTRLHRPDIGGGSSYALSEAQTVSRVAGVAAALGHPVVPLMVRQISMLDYTLATLQKWAPRAPLTRRFEVLLSRLHLLAGMAHVHGWRCRWGEGGVRWHPHPPTIPGDTADLIRKEIDQ